MRIHNNTTIETNDLIKDQRHLINALVDTSKIESITFDKTKTMVFGIDCLLAEFNPTKPLKLKGSIRWFDKLSGTGQLRSSHGSLWFYACNVVGADSAYEHLVTNVDFGKDDQVEFTLSADPFLAANCGAINITKTNQSKVG